MSPIKYETIGWISSKKQFLFFIIFNQYEHNNLICGENEFSQISDRITLESDRKTVESEVRKWNSTDENID